MNIITSNPGKYREYKKILTDSKMHDIGYHEIQADTLEEVVEHGLRELREHAPLIIDDSGLFIDAYKGFPGVYSSYVMNTLGCEGMIKLMDNIEDRKARFECVIGYMDEAGSVMTFKGIVEGKIIHELLGSGGFGYDPIFIPKGYDRTFAQMSTDEKNKISHRGIAMEKLATHIGSIDL